MPKRTTTKVPRRASAAQFSGVCRRTQVQRNSEQLYFRRDRPKHFVSKQLLSGTRAKHPNRRHLWRHVRRDSKDKITLTWVSSLNLEKATIQTTDQSATVGDRTLTFTYTPPSHPEFTLTQKVTARQFFWVTNNSPGSTCSPGYGWLYNYVYTPYTHPDGVVVPGGGLLTGTATTENFNPDDDCVWQPARSRSS